MEILIQCAWIALGCYEYSPASCAEDVFYAWQPVPCGEMPAACDDSDKCIPREWEGVEVVRRLLADCSC